MVSSLKAVIPKLAVTLGTSAAALYERQRALVRAGLLEKPDGRGPGSGVAADAHSVAMLLIALLATENLSETEGRVRDLWMAKPPKGVCILTGRSSLVDAIAQILSLRRDLKKTKCIKIDRTHRRAVVEFVENGDSKTSQFIGSTANLGPTIAVDASIDQAALQTIAQLLADESGDDA